MSRKIIIASGFMVLLVVGVFIFNKSSNKSVSNLLNKTADIDDLTGEMDTEPYALSIESLRQGDYPGSDLVIEQALTPGSNYSRYIVSYKTEGLKNFALLTVPNSEAPVGGWPAIIFNHGFIPPAEYRTTERYIAYTDAFSRNGYILLRPDYRGHGNSEGEAAGGMDQTHIRLTF